MKKRNLDVGVAKQIYDLHSLSHADLRTHYQTLYGQPPMPLINKKMLIQRIAYRLQEKVFGGLSQKCLKQIADKIDVVAACVPIVMPGARLVKIYKGVSHEVTVREAGLYSYNGIDYTSLSSVAKAITGQQRNGREFFDVRC